MVEQRTADVNLLELERQVCFALALASRGVIAVYRPVLEPLQLTHPQYLVMLALWQYAPLSVTELSELVQLEPATVSPLLKRLEQVGYLQRERNPDNERALRITLTPEGIALRSEALKIPEKIMSLLDLDLDDVQELHGFLGRLIDKSRRVRPNAT